MAELIDVLDENGIKTGEVLSRNEIHQKGLWHRAIVVAIVNKNNQVLLQQRSFKKIKMQVSGIFQLQDIFQRGKMLYPQQLERLMKK